MYFMLPLLFSPSLSLRRIAFRERKSTSHLAVEENKKVGGIHLRPLKKKTFEAEETERKKKSNRFKIIFFTKREFWMEEGTLIRSRLSRFSLLWQKFLPRFCLPASKVPVHASSNSNLGYVLSNNTIQ